MLEGPAVALEDVGFFYDTGRWGAAKLYGTVSEACRHRTPLARMDAARRRY